MKSTIVTIFLLTSFFTSFAQLSSNEKASENSPLTPEVFMPGIVSDEYGNRDMAISPDGNEMFYTLQYRGGFALSVIMHLKKVKGKWSAPEVAAFSGQYSDEEPAFSADGTKLYFSSDRPLSGSTKKDFDIWYVTKVNGAWSNPQNLGSPVNTDKDEFYPSVAKTGNIYFTRQMDGKDEDIVVCHFNNNKYDTAVSLPDAVNTTGGEFNAFIDPYEQFIIFTGYKRKGNIGSGDLFISKKDINGNWLPAQNLGETVNGNGLTYCPYITSDKKYFFFTSSRGIFKTPFGQKQTFKDLKKLLNAPMNGWDNIYRIDASVVFNQLK